MVFLWALLLAALAFVLYTAIQFQRYVSLRATGRMQPSFSRLQSAAASQPRRRLQWVSLRDCASILAEAGDLIVIDLRPESRRTAFPIAGPSIMSVHPGELSEVLEWLPPERGAIFYGASALCISLIQTSPCMCGSAPVYLVTDDPAGMEAA
ncbi:MAG TPA: hypothetical protein VMD92_18855 [Acidobacteriaceae bacterium]|jgi:hypothetical protein|nr:hypothetical protein [Acidobacteriaceae bacterium]